MSNGLYACICAEEFPAQALLRLRTDLAVEAVVVLDGKPPLETVCSMNQAARRKRAELGMTRLECETIEGLQRLVRSEEMEAAARAVMLECAAQFSPRLEAVTTGTDCGCVLDITGTERLFGAPAKLAARLKDALATAGLRVAVSVSTNFHTARLKAATTHGITVVPAGHEATALARLPVEVLQLPASQPRRWRCGGFELWESWQHCRRQIRLRDWGSRRRIGASWHGASWSMRSSLSRKVSL